MITMTTTKLFSCIGGDILLPQYPMIDRENGGNLWVVPPRQVWERNELAKEELVNWSFLIAAAGKAMLDVLPQLQGGCINYWEAGNWALNPNAEPRGKKIAKDHRKVHMHLIGRSPNSTDDDWKWGEAPKYPDYVDSKDWSLHKKHLSPKECSDIVLHVEEQLLSNYSMSRDDIQQNYICEHCQYPTPVSEKEKHVCITGPQIEDNKQQSETPVQHSVA